MQLSAVLVSVSFISSLAGNYDEHVIFDENSIGPAILLFPYIVLPGTKWCGPGDEAEDFNDLGIASDLDMCCREHDNCFDYICPKERKHGVYNPDQFTRLHCDCEQQFINCLQNVGTISSNAVGGIYFAFRKYCLKYEYPIVNCSGYQEGFIFVKRCVRYKLDTTKPKKWQWFENPLFSSWD